MASKCRKFVPNMFNKTKCQACFGSKEAHSAAALENNKAIRKVSKCGYLFVAPNFDFNNPMDRSRRWQRRFFRLYDDGELTFCVDDHMDTVPQGSVDMNLCTDILEAEVITSHCHSLAVVTPDKTEYIKADSREEIQWWHDVLVKFPNNMKALKTRRKPNYVINSNKENVKPTQNEENAKKPPPAPTAKTGESSSTTPTGDHADLPTPHSTFKGVRSLKHKSDKDHQEGLRKSSSLHDLTSEEKVTATVLASSRFLSSSGDQLDALDGDVERRVSREEEDFSADSHFPVPRSSCPSSLPSGAASSAVPASAHSPAQFNSSSSLSTSSSRSLDERPGSSSSRSKTPRDQGFQNSRDAPPPGMKDFSAAGLSRGDSGGGSVESGERRGAASVGGSLRQEGDEVSQSMSADETDSNETDELKDLVYMKKGWLIKQTSSDRESRKHWFVLAGNALCYYQDAKAEESNTLDGRIDLSTCYEVAEESTPRNYGIMIKTDNGEYTLAAMTAGIRSNWMKALRLCMDLHSPNPKLPGLATTLTAKTLPGLATTLTAKTLPGLATTLTAKTLPGLTPPRSADDVDASAGASALTPATMVTGAKGETAFQLVGRRDPVSKKETRNVRRHHSEVNAGSGRISLAEFGDRDVAVDAVSSPGGGSLTGEGPKPSQVPSLTDHDSDNKADSSPKTPKTPRYSSSSADSWSHGSELPLNRYVEGSDSVATTPVQSADNRRSKRNIASETAKEEEKRETTLHAKGQSARMKEKSRAAKTPRLHSPPSNEEDFECRRPSESGQSTSSQLISDDEHDLNMTISSEENYHSCGDIENQEESHPDSIIGEGSMMVEILESEVVSLKERLDQTQSELVKMHETNINLKTRLQKETAQLPDSSYGSGRWSQSPGQPADSSQTMKRQLKESRDTVQKQRVEIESLKSKLDMSASKLTGTERALSEALKEHKQEKDKFLKMSSEWNRRIRVLEGQVKDSTHKQERIRESLLNKERECRRLETEAKQHQQKLREQDRKILKLKAVENEYNQLKEQLDNRDRDLHSIHTQLHDRDSLIDKIRAEFEQQIRELETEFSHERDDLENHLEEVKKQLHTAEEEQESREKNITTNLADLLGEKDDIIAQLEEKLIEHDTKMVDMQEELQAEMGENSDLAHNLEVMEQEKHQLQDRVISMETQSLSLKSQVKELEKDNTSLKQTLEKVQHEHVQLSAQLKGTSKSSDPEKLKLEKTVQDMRKQIQGLQLKLMEKLEDFNSPPASLEQDDALQKIAILESDVQEVNLLLSQLQRRFNTYVSSLRGEAKQNVSNFAEMMKKIGEKCLLLQGSFQEGSHGILPELSSADYHHTISVNASSGSSVILEEYQSLKRKFDRIVAEVKKLKKEEKDVQHSSGDLEKNKQRQEQVKSLGQRVDRLTEQLAAQHSEHTLPARKLSGNLPSHPSTEDIQQLLSQVESRIQTMEQILAKVSKDSTPVLLDGGKSSYSPSASQSPVVVSRLQEMRHQLDDINKDLKNILSDLSKSKTGQVSPRQGLVSWLDECGGKLTHLAHTFQEKVKLSPGTEGSQEGSSDVVGMPIYSASSMGHCLQSIMDKLQEIGEQLDCLEDHKDDSDDEGEATSIEEVREQLASLCEFVQQHSTFSDLDWQVMQLVSAQKAVISKERLQEGGLQSTNSMNKLQVYAERLSLEALILTEMAHLLERKKTEEVQDPFLQEMSKLNSKVLSLHQKLDQELVTMNVTEASADVLKVQADIMAEKITAEGHLYSGAVCVSPKEEVPEEKSKSVEPRLLAAEAIMRSQLDAYIGHNIDSSCDELWSSACHLTTRSLVQGQLTFALNSLKQQLKDSVRAPQSADSVGDLYLERLKTRHKAVMEVAEIYQQKMIQAFAAIIFKESEDLTITDGSESVLETVCAEISSVMEKHIQRCKVRVRSAQSTLTAHCWDMMVHCLRDDREHILAAIRQQHASCAPESGEKTLEIPCQSLDSSITSFGEIVSLRAILSAHLQFLLEQLKLGNSGLLEGVEEEEEEEEDDEAFLMLKSRLCSFVHGLAEALEREGGSRQTQAQQILTVEGCTVSSAANIPFPKTASPYNQTLMREAAFAAQTTFMTYKLKLLHEQELEAVKIARPARRYKPRQLLAESGDRNRNLNEVFGPLGEVVDAKHSDEMEALRVIASQVDKLKGVVGTPDRQRMMEQVQQLERKVGEEVKLAEERHQDHVTLFKEEQKKIEQLVEENWQERDHYEERCAGLEVDLHSLSHEHDGEVERMRQDVLTAVSAIRANEGQSDAQLTDRVQLLTRQVTLQKDGYMRFLEQLRGQVRGSDRDLLLDLVDKQMKDTGNATHLLEADPMSPTPSHPSPASPRTDDKAIKMEEELELLKKEKDEALAEETRNTKAALDAMRKAYEEELQQERAKYRECLLTMYNEDFVNEIRNRHRAEVEKTKEDLKKVKADYLGKCEDLKELEVKVGQTKQDYETLINQLIMSNSNLEEKVNQEIADLKDFMKKRPSSQSSACATVEEELYDAQITIRVKEAELQKLRTQVKNFESSLHHTTEEHRQTMTQYLQALKENQELRKEFHAETAALQDHLDKALSDLGLKKPVKRVPSLKQRARSPSPGGSTHRRRECASTSSGQASQESGQHTSTGLKDLRRSKSSPSLPFVFNAKGIAPTMKLPSKKDRRLSQKI
ncbi:hypothetical protein ACOMHN_044317 [Nucella lapillus]